MKEIKNIPILGKFEVIKLEELDPYKGQIEINFETTAITFTSNSILINVIDSDVEEVNQQIQSILLQEETIHRKVYVLIADDDSKILLVVPGIINPSGIDIFFLAIFYNESMNSGLLFTLRNNL